MKRIGKITGFHGLRGDVKVRPSSPEPDWVDSIENVTLRLADREVALRVRDGRFQDRLVFLRFENHPDRTSVEPYLGGELWAEESELPPPEEGEFWVDDLIGLAVRDAKTGKTIGEVKDLVSAATQDYLEIFHTATRETQLIPLIAHFVPEINVEGRFVLLDHLDGFFESEAGPSP